MKAVNRLGAACPTCVCECYVHAANRTFEKETKKELLQTQCQMVLTHSSEKFGCMWLFRKLQARRVPGAMNVLAACLDEDVAKKLLLGDQTGGLVRMKFHDIWEG